MLDKLQAVVREVAQQEVMPRFLAVESREKADGSLLTEADLAAQAAFARRLPELIDCPMLGEEMSEQTQRDLWLHNHQGLWVVDPIDGTTNFINGFPHFALSAAYLVQGRARMGVIFNPVSGECFYAAAGEGAYLNGRRLPALRRDKPLKRAVAGVEIKYLRSGSLSSRMNTLSPVGSIRSMGCSTLDWCYLAAGRLDVYVHGGQKLWDYAAGALIFEEAGGCLATLEGDTFWSGEHVFKRSVIAALNPELFGRWLKWIRDNQ
ncbi:inositol monophosphatase family protein [Neisseria leonii]|uniref:Inositol monophosphatase family protein n=1 Tax=Neisseria leonii TaxID=2995413 RepID=A0A9X4IDR9_9NEIS|nr:MULTISPECIES: inositol monophosphatase family protein [unclassified Neisseria]MDD9324948.1 inositol monophosphatase family protein [Neisseria sp. 3986]MDD9327492.1 inositol monophosphatase family protein [Neisseria sp. 51.81]